MLLVNCLPLTNVIVINEKFNAKQCSLIRNRHHELAMDNKHIKNKKKHCSLSVIGGACLNLTLSLTFF